MDNTQFPSYCCENHFLSGHVFMSVLNNAYAYLRIVTGVKSITLMAYAESKGNAIGQMFKGTTYNTEGTEVPVYNNNENSDRQTTFDVYHTPGLNVAGAANDPPTLIFATLKAEVVGSSGKMTPRFLESNTDYLIQVQNISGDTQNISISIEAMEV